MKEVWRPIPMLNGLYAASTLGCVRREVGGKRTIAGRPIKLQVRGRTSPYHIFTPCLGSNASKVTKSAAECVLDAFVGPRPPGHEPEHLNSNSLDDRLDNLIWLHWTQNRPGRPLGTKDRRPRK